MGHLLGYALDGKHWSEAQDIGQPLNEYWKARGQYAEADAWTDRFRLATEDADGTAPALDSPAGSLWIFFVGAQAAGYVNAGRPEIGGRIYREILEMILAQPASRSRQSRLYVTYFQLGRVAQDLGRLDEAEDWYRKSLAISEELGDRPGMARLYHQLGIVASIRGRLDEAEDWYRKSLAISEELGDRPWMGLTYHAVGNIAEDRGAAGSGYRVVCQGIGHRGRTR